MIKKHVLESLLSSLFLIAFYSYTTAQQTIDYVAVESKNILGRVQEVRDGKTLNRLPDRLKGIVRDPVWHLGTNSAGSYVEFQTDSDTLYVRYKVSGSLNMPHMPSTGVSGVDLYARNESSNSWDWAFGQYAFKDTIHYTFNNIAKSPSKTYRLYLPLYNTIQWLEIGGVKSSKIKFLENSKNPIVVYGTSIAQGACASRPGLAWTNILGRKFDNPVINLGFSGNGRLEQPILDLIIQEDAAAFILDCIPNLALTASRSEKDLENLIRNAVHTIRKKYPKTPVILAAHSSANTPGFLNIHTMNEYGASSKVTKATFDKLIKEGHKNLYYVSEKDMGLDIESTVDYAHPNDIGMLKIANAFFNVLKKVL